MEQLIKEDVKPSSTLFQRVGSAGFYAVCSFMIMLVNKSVLTVYDFPSFQVLGLGQMITTIMILFTAKQLQFVDFPPFSRELLKKIWALSVIYFGNIVFGLGGTKELSLPMLTVLRRFAILMTMVLELYILNIRPSRMVQASVFAMIFGNIIAAIYDLSFSIRGYALVLVNNAFTASYGVVMKLKLDTELGKYELMYYNSLIMLPVAVLLAWSMGDIDLAFQYSKWNDYMFLIYFSLSCVLGFLLTYSTLLCTLHNSALTQTVVGCLKNIFITYVGMIFMNDYIFSWANFIGINISMVASLVYTWVVFFQSKPSLNKYISVQESKV